MNLDKTDELLLRIYCRCDALTSRANSARGAGIEFLEMRAGKGVEWHPEAGQDRRDGERVIQEAVKAGLLRATGTTRSRRLALTPLGCWRAGAWLGADIDRRTLPLLRAIQKIGDNEAGGDDVSPDKHVPMFKLNSKIGDWWGGKDPARTDAANDVFFNILPAIISGWVQASIMGRRGTAAYWYKLTDAGCAILQKNNADLKELRAVVSAGHEKLDSDESVVDWYCDLRREEWGIVLEIPYESNDVGMIPHPESRWWKSNQKAGAI